MSRPSVLSRVARGLAAGVVAVLLLPAPAYADRITIFFMGEVDFSSEPGGDVYSYSGSITWNTLTSPFESETGIASYALDSYSLIFDGTDVSIPPSLDGTGNGLVVVNDGDPLGTGTIDGLGFFAVVGRPFDPTGDLALVGILAGPTTMFSSTALPGSDDFLNDLTSLTTLWIFEPDGEEDDQEFFLEQVGTLEITGTTVEVIPEPATISLVGLGLAGAAARARRRRSSL